MYKIYINETPLIIAEQNEIAQFEKSTDNQYLITEYMGKSTRLLNYIDMLEKSPKFAGVVLHSPDHEQLIDDFVSLYKIIEAAGGLVFNDKKEILAIFRRGFWDLPKGKIESEEEKADAAVREVEEETGIKDLTLGDYIGKTYHTFKNKKGHRVIKKTFWYHMHSNHTEFTPQAEEDISIVEWKPVEFLLDSETKTYANIRNILSEVAQ